MKLRAMGKSYLKQWVKRLGKVARILCQKSRAIIKDGILQLSLLGM